MIYLEEEEKLYFNDLLHFISIHLKYMIQLVIEGRSRRQNMSVYDNSSMLKNAGKIAHISSSYEKVNKTGSLQPSVCIGQFVRLKGNSIE